LILIIHLARVREKLNITITIIMIPRYIKKKYKSKI
jgi:hypothetical protein